MVAVALDIEYTVLTKCIKYKKKMLIASKQQSMRVPFWSICI